VRYLWSCRGPLLPVEGDRGKPISSESDQEPYPEISVEKIDPGAVDETEANAILDKVIEDNQSHSGPAYSQSYDPDTNSVTISMTSKYREENLTPQRINSHMVGGEEIASLMTEGFKDAGYPEPVILLYLYDENMVEVTGIPYKGVGYFNYDLAVGMLDMAMEDLEQDPETVLKNSDMRFEYTYDYDETNESLDLFLESNIEPDTVDEARISDLRAYADSCVYHIYGGCEVFGLPNFPTNIYVFDSEGTLMMSYL
jgi:hypothetical protein